MYSLDVKELHTKIYSFVTNEHKLNGFIRLLRYLYFVYKIYIIGFSIFNFK